VKRLDVARVHRALRRSSHGGAATGSGGGTKHPSMAGRWRARLAATPEAKAGRVAGRGDDDAEAHSAAIRVRAPSRVEMRAFVMVSLLDLGGVTSDGTICAAAELAGALGLRGEPGPAGGYSGSGRALGMKLQ